MKNHSPLISVVICTYNRSKLLSNALQSCCRQSLPKNEYELIVIDNNSNDDTAQVVDRFRKDFPMIHYCLEKQVGLSFARNRGWHEARSRYVGYTDDDCEVPEHWLRLAKEIIQTHSPAIFGGPFFPIYESQKPRWFKDQYGTRTFGSHERTLGGDEYIIGNNMFLRRDVLESLQGFNVNLGMKGNQIAYAEESHLQMRLRQLMPEEKRWYHPDLYVYSVVRTERMKLSWMIRQFFSKGRYTYLGTHWNRRPPSSRIALIAHGLMTAAELVIDLTVGVLVRDRTRFPYYQNYYYEHTSHYLKAFGRLYAKRELSRSATGLTEKQSALKRESL